MWDRSVLTIPRGARQLLSAGVALLEDVLWGTGNRVAPAQLWMAEAEVLQQGEAMRCWNAASQPLVK